MAEREILANYFSKDQTAISLLVQSQLDKFDDVEDQAIIVSKEEPQSKQYPRYATWISLFLLIVAMLAISSGGLILLPIAHKFLLPIDSHLLNTGNIRTLFLSNFSFYKLIP